MREPSPEEQEKYDLQQIKQRPSRYQAKPIAGAIRQMMVRRGLGQTQAAQELLSVWVSIAGPLASVSRPANIARGILQVFVQDSSALQELHLQRRVLIEQLSQAMPQLKIRDIKGRVGL